MSEPESLEEQAAQEGFVPEYNADEEPADDFPFTVETEEVMRTGVVLHLYHWRFPNGEEFALFQDRGDAERECEGKPGAEVIGLELRF